MVAKTKKQAARKTRKVKVGQLTNARRLTASEGKKVKGGSVTDLVIDPFNSARIKKRT